MQVCKLRSQSSFCKDMNSQTRWTYARVHKRLFILLQFYKLSNFGLFLGVTGQKIYRVRYSLEKAMATHSSTLAWKIPWTEEPGRLQTMGSWRVGHDWATDLIWSDLSNFTFTFHFHSLEKEMATHSSVLAWRIPRTEEPGGLPSMGSHRVAHNWSNSAAAATKWNKS